MRGKMKLLGLALALLSIGTIGAVKLNAATYVDNSPDCDKYAIVRCGTFSESKIRSEYNKGDHAAVFGAFGISKSETTGMKTGVVYQNGTVKVGGNTVATNAVMSARYLGGSSIKGSSTAKRLSVSHMGSAQTALVKFDSNGRFMFAIMKPCGNPVVGTPTKPKPKPAAVCKALSITKIDRNRFSFKGTTSTANGAKISQYNFKVFKGNVLVKVINVNSASTSASTGYTLNTPGTYTVKLTVTTSVGDKTASNCTKTFTVTEAPVAACEAVSVEKLGRTSFKFNGTASADNGASISQYIFRVYKGNQLVDTKTVDSTAKSASVNYSQETAGDYKVVLTVKTSLGDKMAPNCEQPFTVSPPKVPGVSINKLVNGKDYLRTQVGVVFDYQLKVTNTGEVDLTNVVVTDTPENGVKLVSAEVGSISDNTWTYTIPELKIGESMEFTLKGKVLKYQAGRINNTACVDAPEVPGNPDDCDTAEVEVPKDVKVCNPATRETITVKEEDAKNYAPVGSSQCEEVPVELPTTGPADAAMKFLGLASLTGAVVYYTASRRSNV